MDGVDAIGVEIPCKAVRSGGDVDLDASCVHVGRLSGKELLDGEGCVRHVQNAQGRRDGDSSPRVFGSPGSQLVIRISHDFFLWWYCGGSLGSIYSKAWDDRITGSFSRESLSGCGKCARSTGGVYSDS